MGKQQDWVEIEVVNWERYNPRSDRRNHTWFRVQNSIATEPKFFGLTAEQKFAVICLLAEVSKSGGSTARVHVPWLSEVIKISNKEIHETIRHLVGAGVIRCRADTANVYDSRTCLATDGRTDGRTDTATSSNSESGEGSAEGGEEAESEKETTPEEFDVRWSQYPRKVNKTEARDRFFRLFPFSRMLPDLDRALARFLEHHQERGTEAEYIPHFSSMLGTERKPAWRDWLEADAGQESGFDAPAQPLLVVEPTDLEAKHRKIDESIAAAKARIESGRGA